MLIISFCCCNSVFAQQTNNIDIEKRLEYLEKGHSLLEKDFENKKGSLENKIEEEMIKISQDNNWANRILSFLIGGITGTIGAVFATWWYAKKYADMKLKELFEKKLQDNESALVKLIEEKNVVIELIKNKKIVVCSTDSSDSKFLKSFLEKKGFEAMYINDLEKLREIKADIVIFNDINNKIGISKIEEIIPKLPQNTLRFYYGKGRVDENRDKFPELADYISFANAPAQLYGNLISALHYHDTLV
jgi:hypothetical protein